jgi:nitric oxide reductase subunit C
VDEGGCRWHRIWIGILAFAFVGVSVYAHLHPGESRAEPGEAARRGFRVWRENNCQSCHQLYGLGGYLGPDLTDAAGRVSRARFEKVLARGSPPMPRFEMGENQRADLYEFLLYVDQTGNWPASGWPPPGFAGDR